MVIGGDYLEINVCQLSIATLSNLLYILPPKYTLYLHKAIASIRNSLINSRSSPSTPNELVHGTKPKHRVFPFGTCCMVTQHIDKRLALAHAHHTSVSLEAKAEIGVCMGFDPVTGRTLFVLANGAVVPRRPTSQLASTYKPFDWMPKTFTIASDLPIPSASQPLSQPAPISVIQLPHTPHTHAIDLIMDPIPDPHRPPPPNLLLRPAQHNILSHIPTIHTSTSNPITVISDPLQIQRPTPNASIPFDGPLPSLPLPPTTPGPTPLTQDPPPPLPATYPVPHLPTSSQHLARGSHQAFGKEHASPVHPQHLTPTPCLSSLTIPPAQPRSTAKFNSPDKPQSVTDITSSTTPPLNGRATHIQPVLLPNQRAEMSIRRAKSIFPAAEISSGISKELGKHFETYKSLKVIPRSCIEEKAVFLRSQIFLKKKSNGLITARLAIDGSRQPRSTYNETYAGTSDTTNRAFILQAYLADAAHRDCLDRLQIGDFDFPGAFLHNPLTRKMTNGHQLIVTLPSGLPSPLAGQLAEIIGCCYGIKQANHAFGRDLTLHLTNAGFIPTSSDHHSFHKRCPDNPLDSLTLNMHVDDGWHITSSSRHLVQLKDVLTSRYGPIDFNDASQASAESGSPGTQTTLALLIRDPISKDFSIGQAWIWSHHPSPLPHQTSSTRQLTLLPLIKQDSSASTVTWFSSSPSATISARRSSISALATQRPLNPTFQNKSTFSAISKALHSPRTHPTTPIGASAVQTSKRYITRW